MDGEVQKAFQRLLKNGLEFVMGAAQSVDTKTTRRPSRTNCAATTANAPWTPTPFWSPRAAARSPTAWVTAELGVEISERGQIKTDAHYQTNVAGIYALGDCIDGPMLAHKAEDEGGLRRRSGGRNRMLTMV
jgi:dihydrolipoamide dehydrogenase